MTWRCVYPCSGRQSQGCWGNYGAHHAAFVSDGQREQKQLLTSNPVRPSHSRGAEGGKRIQLVQLGSGRLRDHVILLPTSEMAHLHSTQRKPLCPGPSAAPARPRPAVDQGPRPPGSGAASTGHRQRPGLSDVFGERKKRLPASRGARCVPAALGVGAVLLSERL